MFSCSLAVPQLINSLWTLFSLLMFFNIITCIMYITPYMFYPSSGVLAFSFSYADCCDGSDEYDGVTYCPNTCIMGGSIVYRTELHQTSNIILGKESKPNGRLDMIQNLKGFINSEGQLLLISLRYSFLFSL